MYDIMYKNCMCFNILILRIEKSVRERIKSKQKLSLWPVQLLNYLLIILTSLLAKDYLYISILSYTFLVSQIIVNLSDQYQT